MSVTYPERMPFVGVQRWLNRWWPSTRLRHDPLGGLRVDDRYAPVSISNWKLTPPMARALLATRIARPLTFSTEQRLTVVIPYRDREHHLRQLLPALTAKLDEQSIRHRIVLVEQVSPGLFNRGKLINIGVEYSKADTDYYCFHDVDAIPVVANYRSPSQPLRLVNKIIGSYGERFRPEYYFSGAVTLRTEDIIAANGFSNEYWGWGKEDDDFFFRLLLTGAVCYYDIHGTFYDLPNPDEQQRKPVQAHLLAYMQRNRPRRSLLVRGLMAPAEEGLSTLSYELLAVDKLQHHEKIRVRL